MSDRPTVIVYFDLISPYSWLGLHRLATGDARGARIAATVDPRPVVYAALLEIHGLVGPAESPAKRRYTFHDVARCAQRYGARLTGPPEHPFRSLEALRTCTLFAAEPPGRRLELAAALAHACWAEGRSLNDPAVLEGVVRRVGLDAAGLAERIAAPAVKLALREATEEAVERGVFGVPTFVLDGELFWGHDRLDALERRLAGEPRPPAALADGILSRPRGADRKGYRGRA